VSPSQISGNFVLIPMTLSPLPLLTTSLHAPSLPHLPPFPYLTLLSHRASFHLSTLGDSHCPALFSLHEGESKCINPLGDEWLSSRLDRFDHGPSLSVQVKVRFILEQATNIYREWVVNATPRPLYPRQRPGTHCIGGWVGPRAGVHCRL
jgi:hypothetical protein